MISLNLPASPLAMWMVLLVTGCAAPQSNHLHDLLASGSTALIESEARQMARDDVAAQRPRICHAGTRGVSVVGMPEAAMTRVQDLPKLPLPVGCTEPLAMPAMDFARAYNAEILRLLPPVLKELDSPRNG